MLILIRSCVNSILNPLLHRNEIEEELLQYQGKRTEVNARTAEMLSEQGNSDLTELVVIGVTTQCEACEEHIAKGESFCTCGVIL